MGPHAEPDGAFLNRAVELAVASVAKGGGPFGAVLVKDGEVWGEGHNRVTLDNDPTAHAEMMALRIAGRRLKTFNLAGCVLYSSCEPCPMCLAALHWAHIDRVAYAANGDAAAEYGFDDRRILDGLAAGRPRFPVEAAPCDGPLRPFQAWAAKADKTPY